MEKKYPKNTVFQVPIWAIHHNDKYWPNPEKFDPTRFDAEHKHSITPFSYLPFGGGPRICIGMKFALIEAKIALAYTFQKFTFTYIIFLSFIYFIYVIFSFMLNLFFILL